MGVVIKGMGHRQLTAVRGVVGVAISQVVVVSTGERMLTVLVERGEVMGVINPPVYRTNNSKAMR